MLPKIFDRHHYLNMVHNESAESNIFTSADYSDNVREAKRTFFFSMLRERSILNREECKVEGHKIICRSFDFQINEMYQICSPVLFNSSSAMQHTVLSFAIR